MARAWIARGSVILILAAAGVASRCDVARADVDRSQKPMTIPHIDDYESTLIWVWDEEGPRLEFRDGNPKAKKLSQPLPVITDSYESG